MIDHPSPELLTDFAAGLLPGEELPRIEEHLSACRDCAWLAQRYAIEQRRLSEALHSPVPAGLSEKILSSVSRKPRLPLLPLAAAAGILLSVALAVVAFRARDEAVARVQQLEGCLASFTQERVDAEAFSSVLSELCRVEVESSIAEMVAWAEFPVNREALVREILLAATSTTAELFEGASQGEVDLKELLTVDTFAGLDAELRALMEESEYQALAELLTRMNRAAAECAAEGLLLEIRKTTGISPAQAVEVANFLVEQCAWRRDLAFLPDFARRFLCARMLRNGGSLRPEVCKQFSEEEARRVLAFIERERERYNARCLQLRERS